MASTARPFHPPALDAPRRVLVPLRAQLYRARSASKEAGPSVPLFDFPPLKDWETPVRGWWGCPRLRAFNEGLPRPRVARAKRTAPPSPFPPHSLRIGKLFVRVPWLASTARPFHPPALDAPRRVLAQARARFFYHSFYTLTQGSGQIILYCAHRTSTVSPCAFCEQEGWSGRSLLILLRPRVARAKRPVTASFLFHLPLPKDLEVPEGMERLASTARMERAPFHRARSASKKDGLAAPLSPF